VRVIEEKRVAGFDATVLTARSGADLMNWLKDHGYAYSPSVAEWAAPYLGGDWHFTALKIAKDAEGETHNVLKAGALRISFRTSRPLFPYREPDAGTSRSALAAPDRLLRIYFIAHARYRGEIEGGKAWSGKNRLVRRHHRSSRGVVAIPATPRKHWTIEMVAHRIRRPLALCQGRGGCVFFKRQITSRLVAENGSHRKTRRRGVHRHAGCRLSDASR
jgi:hypothetical protein